MSISYNEFFNNMDWVLKQEIETGDYGTDADRYRILPVQTGVRVLNQVQLDLMRSNQAKFQIEYDYIFNADMTEWKAPDNVYAVVSGKAYSDNKWEMIRDSSFVNSKIRAISQKNIINTDGWSKGDILKLIVVEKPKTIIEVSDLIDERFEDFLELLELEVKERAYGNVGEAFSDLDSRNLERQRAQWTMAMPIVKTKSLRRFTGKSFGRRRVRRRY